jgi:hypothetical protein
MLKEVAYICNNKEFNEGEKGGTRATLSDSLMSPLYDFHNFSELHIIMCILGDNKEVWVYMRSCFWLEASKSCKRADALFAHWQVLFRRGQ